MVREVREIDAERKVWDICATWVRSGYRRVHALLKGEGWEVNVKRAYSAID